MITKSDRNYNFKNCIRYDGQWWRAIECDNIYLVSDQGKIWSVDRKRYLKPYKNNTGYLCVKLPYYGGVEKYINSSPGCFGFSSKSQKQTAC